LIFFYNFFRGWWSVGPRTFGVCLGGDVSRGSGLRQRVVQLEDRLRNAGNDLRQERGGLRTQGKENAVDAAYLDHS